jgi:hypothetical protein
VSVYWLLLAALLPTAAGYAIIMSVRVSRRVAQSRYRPPPGESPDRLAASLRRLRAELELTETSSGLAAKSYHLKVVRGAYLDALGDACTRLGVSPPPGGDRARQADIYQAEAALRERGLDVRQPATP